MLPSRRRARYTSARSSTPKPGEPFTGGGPQVDMKRGTPGFVRAAGSIEPEQSAGIFRCRSVSHAAGVLSTAGALSLLPRMTAI
jgi:hypothetical protein